FLTPLSYFIYLYFSLFYVLVTHLYLHSFPTRRSSDLLLFSSIKFGLHKHNELTDMLFCDVSNATLHPSENPTNPQLSISIYFCRDRKSTRLNSSHVSISYAVFCFKKKK